MSDQKVQTASKQTSQRGLLIRTLSTGRTGTKYLAEAFSNQGYASFHEDLHVGEPSSAIKLYTNMLGDMWLREREKYYSMESNFARPYAKNVSEKLATTRDQIQESRGGLFRLKKNQTSSTNGGSSPVLIHTAHMLTTATPLILREFKKLDIEVRHLILYRNPLKTIHAIYQVEHSPTKWEGAYRLRPASFSGAEGILGAANVWANTYRMAYDQMRELGKKNFLIVGLESFSGQEDYTENVFNFLGLNFDKDRYSRFSEKVLNKPLRSNKVPSTRNSHIFHDPTFVFSVREMEQIKASISDVLDDYGIEWGDCVKDYIAFHAKEKERLGFDKTS